jgi:hypothetical protein
MLLDIYIDPEILPLRKRGEHFLLAYLWSRSNQQLQQLAVLQLTE